MSDATKSNKFTKQLRKNHLQLWSTRKFQKHLIINLRKIATNLAIKTTRFSHESSCILSQKNYLWSHKKNGAKRFRRYLLLWCVTVDEKEERTTDVTKVFLLKNWHFSKQTKIKIRSYMQTQCFFIWPQGILKVCSKVCLKVTRRFRISLFP